MTLIQLLLSSPLIGTTPNISELKHFSPEEIRESIQLLVATEEIDLAYALGDAGLCIYPDSEDILTISGLLAMMRQDWDDSVELFSKLFEIQGDKVLPFTYVMMVRALRCNLNPARALEVVRQGLKKYPNQVELIAEQLSLKEFDQSMLFKPGS